MQHFQIVVVGSGFGGSITAMIAKKLGFSTALIERGRHPRFVIGESSTPLTNLLLEEIAIQYGLECLLPLCKWGRWQRELGRLPCGLKRGFSFYHHEFGRPFEPDPEHERQLLVGASPNEEVADTHWYRPEFDRYLVDEAQKLGIAYWDEVEIDRVVTGPDGIDLKGTRQGQSLELHGEFLIDATGPRGFLHRAFKLPEKPFATMPGTQALFTHFTNVGPLPSSFSTKDKAPPFPPEQAAVHHVFDGGWVWVLKFNHGITSAGVVAEDRIAEKLQLRSGEGAWQKLLDCFPSLAEIFHEARPTLPFRYQPRVAFQSAVMHGPRWALLPSAAGVIELHWQKPSFDAALNNYAGQSMAELETTARLVAALYASMNQFEVFTELTLLYFAAASFSETARRLDRHHLADSFLLCKNPKFSALLDECCRRASESPRGDKVQELRDLIRLGIEPIDVAGLSDSKRKNWFPAQTSDLLAAGQKLGASRDDIIRMLAKCGLEVG